MHTLSTYLNIYTLWFILVSRSSSEAADYRYEACTPVNCGKGPNISFPFYIKGLQNSYCGFPGFVLNCTNGFPVLHLPETEYIVKEISYETRSLRVYDAAVVDSDGGGCVPRIRNASIPTAQFDFAENVTKLRFFTNCSDSMFRVGNGADVAGCGGRILALYEGDGDGDSVAAALRNCEENSVAAVEGDGEEGEEMVEVLRRGFVMKWRASDCGTCESSGGRCGFNDTTYLFRCFCPNRPHYRSCRREKDGSTLIRAAAIFGGAVCLIVCALITFLIWQCKKRSEAATKSDAAESRTFYFGTMLFTYEELMEATNSFDPSKEVGDGGYGTVYHGKLKDGREVAVKRLHEHNCRRMEQFMNEIKILTSLRHNHLVSLYGCSSASTKDLLLVYEYIPNGTLSDHLHAATPLPWPHRIRIALETAAALAYLHKSDIIHRDVKTSNILLDANFSVKLADFGLSRLDAGAAHVSTAPQGTPGYVDPSYHRSYRLSSKSDVYSFGVVLVELVSSRPAVDVSRPSDEINLASLAVTRIERGAVEELVDESLGFGMDAGIARMITAVARLALRCLQAEKEARPSMDEVLSCLNEIRQGDAVVVEKKKTDFEFESSPNAVTDLWITDSTTTTSL
ncbi:LEAF RUST 10 DISEASE-RESISTANCE LOCUS RECEPTOR-LIKE PROTEIN KINASE-like 1.2 [Salvia miltiorrhiza]|uniref:LEAF RUST 10 DISEASE-RESISTANCE LOCUS RECEPTOR-LIKE PROTEIN KINASE-like 1.2 n=1 Tax=Salvia miltiorrhiza TaxID=226208 RepID=UPI0025ACADF9|nr:LEAF RUST 10 DISEASE-RESISTANCE LOCUS RECEPTOR-LIKE PROTEIN KINASE-like 1.2 [Salvia miltiorrhiza]